MKRFIVFTLLIISFFNVAFAEEEQYLLQCKINTQAINTSNDTVISTSVIERFFIIDTLLANVYDANNLPLEVEDFTDENITFHLTAASFNTVVNTQIVYNQVTKKIKLTEMYANNAYSSKAQFITKGEGDCTTTPIERKPIF